MHTLYIIPIHHQAFFLRRSLEFYINMKGNIMTTKKTIDKSEDTVQLLALKLVNNNPLNPRLGKNPRYDTMLGSMRIEGINRVPIEVYENPKKKGHFLTLSGGGTRLTILKEIGAKSIRCIIKPKPDSDADILVAHISENVHRGDCSFYEMARSTMTVLKTMEDYSKANLSKKSDFLLSKGLPSSSTIISLYEKSFFLFDGWPRHPWVSKRTVEFASSKWAEIKRSVRQVALKLNEAQMRELFIIPVIEGYEKKGVSAMLSESVPVFDGDIATGARIELEIAMHMQHIEKLATKYILSLAPVDEEEQEADPSTEQSVEGPAVIDRSDFEVDGDVNSMPGESGDVIETTATTIDPTIDPIDNEKVVSTGITDEKSKLARGAFLADRRAVVADIIAKSIKDLSENKNETVSVELPNQLLISLYKYIMDGIEIMQSGEQQIFCDDGLGRLHFYIFDEKLNFQEIDEKVRSQVIH